PIEALELARAAAGARDVDVFSASIGQQLLQAGRVDEVRIHLVPVLLGDGTRLFESIGSEHIQLEVLDVIEGAKATHLRYAVIRHNRPYARPNRHNWLAAQALTATTGAMPHKIITGGASRRRNAHEHPRAASSQRRPAGRAARVDRAGRARAR